MERHKEPENELGPFEKGMVGSDSGLGRQLPPPKQKNYNGVRSGAGFIGPSAPYG